MLVLLTWEQKVTVKRQFVLKRPLLVYKTQNRISSDCASFMKTQVNKYVAALGCLSNVCSYHIESSFGEILLILSSVLRQLNDQNKLV